MLTMMILIFFALLIGLAGIIGNQYSGLHRMKDIQRSLDDINQKLREMDARSKL